MIIIEGYLFSHIMGFWLERNCLMPGQGENNAQQKGWFV